MIFLSPSLRAARVQAVLDAIGPAAQILCYHGMPPEPGGSAAESVLQAAIPLASPCATRSGATLTFTTAGVEGLRLDEQSIDWVRVVNGVSGWVIDGIASDAAGAGDFKLDSVTGFVGGTVKLLSGTISE